MQECGMHTAEITRLFQLFACLESVDTWYPLVEMAMQQVRHECKPEVDLYDRRLSFYCAALANLYYRQILAARGIFSPTYAGSVTAERNDEPQCSLAERLAMAYREAASELLQDGSFYFRAVS